MTMMETDVTSKKFGGKVMQKIENWSRIRRSGFLPIDVTHHGFTQGKSFNLVTFKPPLLQPSALLIGML
jgi:hypothetical protein